MDLFPCPQKVTISLSFGICFRESADDRASIGITDESWYLSYEIFHDLCSSGVLTSKIKISSPLSILFFRLSGLICSKLSLLVLLLFLLSSVIYYKHT